MRELLNHLPLWGNALVGTAAALAAFMLIRKVIIKPVMAFVNRINSGMDTLLGYGAVLDPGSGKQLKPPTPALALRVDTLEEAMNRLIDQQEKMLDINGRLLELEQWRKDHEVWSEEQMRQLHEADIAWKKEHEAMHVLAHDIGQQVGKAVTND